MQKQGNMAQKKKQNKSAETNPKEMEGHESPDKELKIKCSMSSRK